MRESLPVVVLEDDEALAKALKRALRDTGPVLHVPTLGEFGELVRQTDDIWAALIDICLPDGSGLSAIEAIRDRYGGIPVLVLTGLVDQATSSRAQLLGAQYLIKPVTQANLMAFMEWAAQWHQSPAALLKKLVDRLAQANGLSPRESQVVYHAALGVAPRAIHSEMGVTVNTVKTLTRRALKKTRARSLSGLVTPLQQTVMEQQPGEQGDQGDQGGGGQQPS
jgi:DNA-binding NarL/FixJ family response regulator